MNRNATGIRVVGDRLGMPFPFNKTERWRLPDDTDARVFTTVAAMCAMTHHAICASDHVAAVAGIVNAGGQRYESLSRLWGFLKQAQRHVPDPANEELLRHPHFTAWQARSEAGFDGDCDCVAMLGAAIAARMGFRAIDFVVTAREGRSWEHVYFRVQIDRTWYAMDPQENPKPFDERAYAARLDFPVWRF